MSGPDIAEAARVLAAARQESRLLDALPENCKPATIAQAHAIQLATAEVLDDPIVGWKVAKLPEGSLGRGALLRSRIYAEGASIPPTLVPLLGIEAEIAFRLDRGLPPRSTDYSYEEVAGAVTAMPAIEIVDSRLRGYPDSPLLDRLADCMSNGAFVHGPPIANWRSLDLAALDVELAIDGQIVVRQRGGHVAGDPLLPAVALANDMRLGAGLAAGIIVTTGTYTGLQFAKPGAEVVATFDGIGSVTLWLR